MAQLNAKQRDALPDSAFAIVKTVNGKKVREYPVHDENHASMALSMVAKHGSPEEKAQVRKVVCRRYPKMGICASMKIAARLKGGK